MRKSMKNNENELMLGLGYLPPQEVDLEEAILGAMLLETPNIDVALGLLKKSSFYKDVHATIFQTIEDMYANREKVDLLTVTSRLRKSGNLEIIGGPYYLTELSMKVNSGAHLEQHCYLLREAEFKRLILTANEESIKKIYMGGTDVFDVLDIESRKINYIFDQLQRRKPHTMKEVLKQNLDHIQEIQNDPNHLLGIPSGFTDLDELTGGWADSDLIIIAARPSMGKTAFALICARNAVVNSKKRVLVISLEMSSDQLGFRLMSTESEIALKKVRRGDIDDAELDQLINKISPIYNDDFIVDDSAALSILELRAKATTLHRKNPLHMVIVDYLQLLTGNTGRNREQEISEISRGLKTLAKELNIPVIALSQLSRAVEQRGGAKRPMLSDLRESGSLEQDADLVIFMYRPEYYQIMQTEDGSSTSGLAFAIVAKHRNGNIGEAPLKFIKKYTKFTDYVSKSEREEYSVNPNENEKEDLPF